MAIVQPSEHWPRTWVVSCTKPQGERKLYPHLYIKCSYTGDTSSSLADLHQGGSKVSCHPCRPPAHQQHWRATIKRNINTRGRQSRLRRVRHAWEARAARSGSRKSQKTSMVGAGSRMSPPSSQALGGVLHGLHPHLLVRFRLNSHRCLRQAATES